MMAGNRMAFNGSFDLTGQPPVPTQREQYGLGQGLDFALQADPYAAQRAETAAQDDTGPDYFGKGRGLRDAVGYGLGAFAQQLGGSNPYDALLKRQSDQRDALSKLTLAAKLKAGLGNDDSPFIADAKAIGLIPGTPQFAKWVTDMRKHSGLINAGGSIYNPADLDTEDYGLGWGGAPVSSAPGAQETKIGPDGKTYYKVGPAADDWYDNPEGN